MKRFLVLLTIVMLLLPGCRAGEEGALRGRVLLWHDWNAADTAVLDDMLAGFNALYPEVRVISVATTPGTLRQRYEETAVLGLGPDLVILSDGDVRELADARLIRPLPDDGVNRDRFLSTALASLRYQDALYGLPLSLRPAALYYDAARVDAPPRTLDELLQQAGAGHGAALNTQFVASLWGLQAFGGRLFDAEGRVTLDQGGYTNWLNWLKTAQEMPGMILERNDETLRRLFVEGRVAFYVGDPRALPDLRAQMGSERVRVAPLPAGPFGPAGPLLHVEALLLNHASSEHQAALALALADYLTNAEQGARLMREANRVPANSRVRVDQQAFPALAGFAAQARTAVAAPQQPQMAALAAQGEDMVRGVLAGTIEVSEAAVQLAQRVNEQFDFAPRAAATAQVVCDVSGTVRLWHGWRDEAQAALRQVTADFMAQCPQVNVELRQFGPGALLAALLEGEGTAAAAPDLILGPSDWVWQLVDAERITPLDGAVENELLQRFVPAAQNTLRVDGDLYGLPLSLNLVALYYNAGMVADPPATLAELLAEAAAGRKVALPTAFAAAYWGVGAFGGGLFDDDLRLSLVETGFVEWLAWLQQAQETPGVFLSRDDVILQALFASEAVTYYAGPARRLAAMQAELGVDAVRVAVLPAGPGGLATPRLSTEALLLPAASQNEAAALAFARFVTAAGAQTTLMAQAQLAPANVNVDTSGLAAVSGFLAQAQTAVVWPQGPQVTAVLQQGDQVYESVTLRRFDPAQAACDFEARVNEANGFTVDEANLPELCRALLPDAVENGE